MRLVVTGGGTGGHVYPALEVAKLAISEGNDVSYFGSLRGIEGNACRTASIEFKGYRSAPISRFWTPAGIRGALTILRSSAVARKDLANFKPDVLFSTGGYAASPVLTAAKYLGIPIVIHEQNSVPGRTNRIAAGSASRICIVFEKAREYFPDKVVHTGMPLRQLLIDAASHETAKNGFLTLCYGGSQGSAALNEAVLTIASRVSGRDLHWLHISGPKLFESVAKTMERICPPAGFSLKAYLPAEELSDAYQATSLAIVRAGCGTICELALFGIPGIYVPLPHAHANHQFHNARAIEKIAGGSTLPQSELTPERLESEWRAWHDDEERRAKASSALRAWSVPDATQKVLSVVKEVADAAAKRS